MPSWSPDSKSIAFYSFRNGNRDIFVMSADGKEVQQITNDPAEERYPDWSPDGQSIVFFSDKTGGFELYVISKIDGNWGRSRPLTNQPSVWLHWSPDGRFIAYNLFLPPPHGGVAIISPDGSGRRLMAPSQPSFLPQYPIWSRNSRTLYFKVNDAENHASLWSVPLAGGAAKPLVKFEDPLRTFYRSEFAASEKEFFFTMTEREADIWVLQMQP